MHSGERDELTVVYQPPGPVAEAFLHDDSFVRGIRGPFGSGKSTVCCVDILKRITQQAPGPDGKRRSRWAIVRNTYPELKTTTIPTWHQIVDPRLGRWVDQGPPTHQFSDADLDAEVMFLALDSPRDVKKLLSMDLTGAWINEAREVPKAVLDGLTARCGRYPSQAMGGPSWFGVLMDTNPPDDDHWWYRLAEEDRPRGFRFFAQPSGLSEAGENVENLPPGYYQNMLAGKTEDWIKVYVHGEYGLISDGKPVYPEYVDSLHCKPFELDRRVPLAVGIDFGLTPAAIIGQRNAMGRCLWRWELVATDMGVTRFGKMLATELRRLEQDGYSIGPITGDPAGEARDYDETTAFQILKAAGLDAHPANTNEFSVRRDAVGEALSSLTDGGPRLIIHPDCKVTRKGMAGRYQYKRVQVAGDERYHNEPDKNEYSHPCEAGQYLMLGVGEGKRIVRRSHGGRQMPRYAQM